jgi:hypothetical protein
MHFRQLLAAVMFAASPGVAAEDEGLVIVDAKWKSGSREANVTSKIRARVHDDSMVFRLSVEALGDPYKGHSKILHITYRYHGVEHTLEEPEGWTLRLPQETAGSADKTFSGDQRAQVQRITAATKVVGMGAPKKGMEIVQVVFGTNGIWRDVTDIVREQLVEGRWKADLHPPYSELGGDPAKGREKHLIVGYRLDGTAKVTIFDSLGDASFSVSLP